MFPGILGPAPGGRGSMAAGAAGFPSFGRPVPFAADRFPGSGWLVLGRRLRRLAGAMILTSARSSCKSLEIKNLSR